MQTLQNQACRAQFSNIQTNKTKLYLPKYIVENTVVYERIIVKMKRI